MAVAFRASSGGSSVFTATASPVVTKTAGVTDGDLVLLFCGTDTTHATNAVAGWTQVLQASVGTDSTLTILRKFASGEPASWTLTSFFTATQTGVFGVAAYTGVDTTSPINASASGTTTTAALKSGPSITPTVDNCMILQFGGGDPPSGAFNATPDTSPVATEEVDATTGGATGWVYLQDVLQGVAAALALDHTASTATLATVVAEIALAPAVAAAARGPARRRVSAQSVRVGGAMFG